MRYLIMLCTVIGLAFADFLTGLIKACLRHDLSSRTMRKGGLNKLCEIIVMTAACGLEAGIAKLGQYGSTALPAELSGTVTSGLVFAYITLMELISILENYGEISPDAVWVRGLIRKLRSFRETEQKDREDTDHEKRH